jgi:hypothetical protein
MLIQMLETRRGSEDGFAVRCFQQGQCYDMADTLARALINAGFAIEPMAPVSHNQAD